MGIGRDVASGTDVAVVLVAEEYEVSACSLRAVDIDVTYWIWWLDAFESEDSLATLSVMPAE